MTDKRPSINSFIFKTWLGVCLLLTAACGTVPSNTPIPQPTCTSIPLNSNPYLSHDPSGVIRNIYQNSAGKIPWAKQEALSKLGENTKHWSDHVDIAVDDSHMVRIVVTYLDPVLIQYVVLNHMLAYPQTFQGDINAFDAELQKRMNNLGKRNEMLFVVTITTPFYMEQAYNDNVLHIRIPIEQMDLISTADIRIHPTHEDHILDENIDITHGPVHGIVGYPIAIFDQTQCVLVMDQYSTTLTLDVPELYLDNTRFDTQFWSIPYYPLVMEDNIYYTSTYDPNFDFTRSSQLATPPTPNWEPNAVKDSTDWDLYWQEMGRYIWNVVITASHH